MLYIFVSAAKHMVKGADPLTSFTIEVIEKVATRNWEKRS